MLKQLILLTKNSMLGSAASFLLTIALANHLGPSGFGMYSYIFLIGTIFSILVTFSTDTVAPVLYASTKNKVSVINTVYSIRLLFFIMLLIISPFLWLKEPALLIGVFAIVVPTLNFSFFYEISNNNVSYSYIYLVERISYVMVVFCLIFLNIVNINNVFFTLLLFSMLSLAWQFYKNSNVIRQFKFMDIKELFLNIKSYSLLVFITFSTFAYGGFSRLIIENKYGIEKLGIYSAGWQLIMAVIIFQSQVTRVWRLKISSSLIEQDKKNFYKNIKSYFLFSTLPVIILSIFVYIFSNDLINLLFGSKYLLLLELMPIFTIYFVIINLDSLAKIFWVSTSRRREYLIVNVGFSVILIICLYLLPNDASLSTLAKVVVGTHAVSVFILIFRFYLKYIKHLNYTTESLDNTFEEQN